MVSVVIMMEEILLVICASNLLLDLKWKRKFILAASITLLTWPVMQVSKSIAGVIVIVSVVLLIRREVKHWLPSIGVPLYILLIGVLADSANSVILSLLSQFTQSEVTYDHWLAIPTTMIMYTLGYVMIYFIHRVMTHYKQTIYYVSESRDLKLIVSVVVISAFGFYLYAHTDPFNMFGDIRMLALLAILVILISSLLLLLTLRAINQVQKKQKDVELQQLLEYTTRLEDLYKSIRVFKHDYVNSLSSIYGYVETNDLEGLKTHFKEVILPYNKQIEGENVSFGALSNISFAPLKGILCAKLIDIYNHKLAHCVEIADEIDSVDMNPIDLCRMVGILMDNAIEAALESVDKSIEMMVLACDDAVTISVRNSCSNELLPLYKMFEPGCSTKGEHRGMGLFNYRKIANQYPNVLTETEICEGYVNQVMRVDKLC